ncbi:MAG: hypothetical protein N3G77_07300 [Nitrososphaeria archaeon]|nr:hypothetical protein [Nitrososphaeria archaeon]MDW7986570.1 hypothetical protein [Nitrososphaerota archaeon]
MSMLSPLEKGRAHGKLSLECFEKVDLNKMLEKYPEYLREIEMLKKKDLKIEYVDHLARVLGEIDIDGIDYQLLPWSPLHGNYSILIDVGTTLPIIKNVELDKLVYRISTEKMKNDVIEIDLVKREIIHINEVFWEWEEGLEKESEKFLEALETWRILKWLIEEKGYNLGDRYEEKRYRRISEILERLMEKPEQVT